MTDPGSVPASLEPAVDIQPAGAEAPRLGSERLVLRPFDESDLGRIVQAGSDPRTQHWLVTLPRTYTLRAAAAYVESTRELAAQRRGLVWCVADPADDRCLGAISLDGLDSYAPRAEIGYWTHPQARGRGLMTEAVRLITGWAVDTGRASAITIRCAAGNVASRHVAEAAGYRELGTIPASEPLGDGSIDDLVLYSRI